MTVFTIGHSTRPLDEFIALLDEAKIGMLADVRRFPGSRMNPQFNGEALAAALAARGIGYRHLEALGGRRSAEKGSAPSPNTLWREAAFRAYADYAATQPFRAGLEELLALAREHQVAIMCAEAVWWRCHRRIVSDYLLARGIEVRHILGPGKIDPAEITPGAEVGPEATLIYRKPGDPPRIPGL